MQSMFLLLVSFLLSSCGFIHTKASLEKAKREEAAKVKDKELDQSVAEKVVENEALWVDVQEVNGSYSYSFPAKKMDEVLKVFVKVLEADGYTIAEKDLLESRIIAEHLEEGFMASGNASFNTSSNYVLGEGLSVEIKLAKGSAGVIATLIPREFKEYSMGQQEFTASTNKQIPKQILTKVKLAL